MVLNGGLVLNKPQVIIWALGFCEFNILESQHGVAKVKLHGILHGNNNVN